MQRAWTEHPCWLSSFLFKLYSPYLKLLLSFLGWAQNRTSLKAKPENVAVSRSSSTSSPALGRNVPHCRAVFLPEVIKRGKGGGLYESYSIWLCNKTLEIIFSGAAYSQRIWQEATLSMCCCDSNELSPRSAARLTLPTLARGAVCSDSARSSAPAPDLKGWAPGEGCMAQKGRHVPELEANHSHGKRQQAAQEVGTPSETQGIWGGRGCSPRKQGCSWRRPRSDRLQKGNYHRTARQVSG